MRTFILSLGLLMTPNYQSIELRAENASVIEATSFEVRLSQITRDELSIIDRLGNLRLATEKLPDDWQSTMKVDGDFLYKRGLLYEINEMEFQAAARWEVLLRNLATLKKQSGQLTTLEFRDREKLAELLVQHQNINSKLDRFNAQLKEGILLNLADRLRSSSN
jgi:hypothetical protein